MSVINGLGVVGARGPERARPGAGGFRVAGEARPAQGAAPAMAPAGLAGLLSLQEGETDAVRDRAARKHGTALLKELSTLQAGLLSGADDPAALRRLVSLAGSAPDAADPGLRGVLRATSLRAQIELARRGSDAAAM